MDILEYHKGHLNSNKPFDRREDKMQSKIICTISTAAFMFVRHWIVESGESTRYCTVIEARRIFKKTTTQRQDDKDDKTNNTKII